MMQIGPNPKIALHIEEKEGKIFSSRLSLAEGFFVTEGISSETLSWLEIYAAGISSPLPQNTLRSWHTMRPFQLSTLEYLERQVPFGTTITYQQLARSVDPKALHPPTRAVGTVCGKNPLPLFIPCHRVIRTGGKIGGFAFPIEIKKRLLEFEGVIPIATIGITHRRLREDQALLPASAS